MKKLLLLIFLLPVICFGQQNTYDSTQIRQKVGGTGFEWKQGKFTGVLIFPDTVKLAEKDSNAIGIHNGVPYIWYNMVWNAISATGVDTTGQFVHTVTKDNDSTIRIWKGATSTTLLIKGSPGLNPIAGTNMTFTGTWPDITFNSSGGGGANIMFKYQSTAPTDTGVIWVNTTTSRLGWYPYQYYFRGAWSPIDTTSGFGYDTVGRAHFVKRPISMIAAGQSNLTSPDYLQPDGFVGDTLSDPRFTVFDSATLKWKVAHHGQYPFAVTVGANHLFLLCKKLVKETGRSVRLVVQHRPGQALSCWNGGIPDTSSCYMELKNRIIASNIGKADLFLWDQGEGGGTNYFNVWRQMNDSLRKQNHTDSTTKVLLIGLANFYSQLTSVGGTDPEGALRALGMTKDYYIGHVSTFDIPNDGIHFIPRSGQRIADRSYQVYLSLPRNVYTDVPGYGYIQPGGLTGAGDTSKRNVDGQMQVNVNGYPYVKTGVNDVFYGDPIQWPTRTGLHLLKTSGSGTMRLTDYGGNILSFLNDGFMRWNGVNGAYSPSWNALNGSSPYVSLYDGTNRWRWIAQWSPAGNTFFDYNGTNIFSATTQGNFVVGSTTTPQLDPMKRVNVIATDGGLGLPVMTPAQKVAIKGVTSVTVGGGGSGYVNGTNAVFTGGGGTGAAGTVSVTAGAITAINMTSYGKGYTSAPTVTAPTGSGATLTAVLGTKEGILVADSSGTRPGYYTGTAWKSLAFLDEISGGGGGGGSTNSNIGSGFRWAVPTTNNIKTFFAGWGISIDSSSNTNGLTGTIDTATLFARVRQIINDTASTLRSDTTVVFDTTHFTTNVSGSEIAVSLKNHTGLIDLMLSGYTITEPGTYEVTDNDGSFELTFPDPVDFDGATITLVNTSPSGALLNSSVTTNNPYSIGGASQFTEIIDGGMYVFRAINGKWRGGQLTP